ncbi:hypothetical protein evm_010316 [Chilo suppressalis]|nr:hypothetical protein evm_010316 [Chilo suppressalis]
MQRRTLDNVGETMKDMQKQEKSGQYKNFCRMAPEDFDHLLSLIGDKIRKSNTNFRDSIPAYDKLAVTLRFLATGDSYESLMYFSKISKSSIYNDISEVCVAINEALQDYAKTPSTEEEWLSIAQEFNEKWIFPNCIGAVDGKHCVIQAPIKSGSDFFNYKSTFSVVLMAIVDANYNFIFADVGAQDRISDGGVFRNTSLYQKLQKIELNIPNDRNLPGRQQDVPFVFVADDAFPLQRQTMKPYPGTHDRGSEKRIYNYRLTRARRIVENAFGILSAVFRVLRKPMLLQHDKASLIVMTCVYLNNYLMKKKASRRLYNSPGMMDRIEEDVVIPGQWRNVGRLSSFLPLPNTGRRHTLQCE